jgi:hypothetical protein
MTRFGPAHPARIGVLIGDKDAAQRDYRDASEGSGVPQC